MSLVIQPVPGTSWSMLAYIGITGYINTSYGVCEFWLIRITHLRNRM